MLLVYGLIWKSFDLTSMINYNIWWMPSPYKRILVEYRTKLCLGSLVSQLISGEHGQLFCHQ